MGEGREECKGRSGEIERINNNNDTAVICEQNKM